VKYRKRPTEVEAVQFVGDNWNELTAFFGSKSGGSVWQSTGDGVLIFTLEGNMLASKDDWIVRGVEGEFYPVKPSIFAATYEPAVS
jgi:hypothetical protein